RQQRTHRRPVENGRVLVGTSLAVDRASRWQRFAMILRDLDLAFGDRRRRDVEDQRRAVGTGRAGGDRVRRKTAVGSAMRRHQDAEAGSVDEMQRREPRLRYLLRPRADAAEMPGIAD